MRGRAAPNRSLTSSGGSWTWAVRSYGLAEPLRSRAQRIIFANQMAAIAPVIARMLFGAPRREAEDAARAAMRKVVNRLPSGP